ncbi:hypothetical protein BH24CHL4_BH24CHL4_13640 [soil metagenome]
MDRATVRRHVGKAIAGLAVAALLISPAADATAKQESIVSGAWMETLGAATDADSKSSMVQVRLTLEPGARLRGHDHPGSAIITVESGVLETELIRGTGAVHRGADDLIEVVSAGSGGKVMLHEGDSISYEQNCGKTMANAGEEPLVMIMSLLVSDGQPLFSFDAPPPSYNPTLQ